MQRAILPGFTCAVSYQATANINLYSDSLAIKKTTVCEVITFYGDLLIQPSDQKISE